MRPYAVLAPPYMHTSAGCRALHVLADQLNARGIPARIGAATPDEIAVLPEVVQANPTDSERVVRWALNRPGYLAPEPPDDGPWFTFSRCFDDGPRLHVPIIDLDRFHPKAGRGVGTAYWVGRGENRPELGGIEAVEITHAWPPDPDALADLLRSVEVLVSFDPMCNLNWEATLVGTPLLTWPIPGWTRAEVERHEYGTHGWGWETLRCADDVALARPRYEQFLAESASDVDAFVAATQALFDRSAAGAR